ncbi:hypothetical protein DY218_12875 [Streptomyces triticagri]|uniref:Uncharacterized protein n=1 Tax=Streptomyces triticagri TaxID=2293568 RepID=A0A372M6Z9_9ACTN|nr:hypothetical protein [Streptomyces triticagri]RFU86295.1 hypothetical protein DY218_12875 [Streptomyces triticagri]
MLRHDFEPGRLIVGLAFTGAGVVYLGSATGGWEPAWFLAIPIVAAGLILGAIAGVLSYAIRRRTRRNAPVEPADTPPDTDDTTTRAAR